MTFPAGATLADVGEFGLIAELAGLFPQGEHVLVGPGDDAAVLRVRNGHVVVSTDLLVEGRHFRRDWASAEDVGHRAAAQNLSDINAMGGTRPLADHRAGARRPTCRPRGPWTSRVASPRSATSSAPASSAATSPRRPRWSSRSP